MAVSDQAIVHSKINTWCGMPRKYKKTSNSRDIEIFAGYNVLIALCECPQGQRTQDNNHSHSCTTMFQGQQGHA